MNNLLTFLKSVLSRPEDDLPLAIFCDWLDETGDDRGIDLRRALEHMSRSWVIDTRAADLGSAPGWEKTALWLAAIPADWKSTTVKFSTSEFPLRIPPCRECLEDRVGNRYMWVAANRTNSFLPHWLCLGCRADRHDDVLQALARSWCQEGVGV